MKYKIKYFLTGGEQIKSNYYYYKNYIGSYKPTNFRTEIPNFEIEYFSVNPNDNRSTQDHFNNINNNYLLTTMMNSGFLENNRHMTQTELGYSNQCMYISIYDYLILKKKINLTFADFRDKNKIKTEDYEEWDNKDQSHEDNIINLCKNYQLDIRIWKKTEHKKLVTYIPEGDMKEITIFHEGKYLITPIDRYGPGNSNIVNIAFKENPRHFELILGGSFFDPLLNREEFNSLPIQYASHISNNINTTFNIDSINIRPYDIGSIIDEYSNNNQDKINIKTFGDLYDKDTLYRDYFNNYNDPPKTQEQEQEQKQERQQRKRQKEQERLEQQKQQERELQKRRERQEQEPLEQQQQEQQEQEDDDFFNYENNELVEKFQSWYCDDQNFSGDKYESNYYSINSWQNWKDTYCDLDNDVRYLNDWYDEEEEQHPQSISFLDDYFEYYNNN